MNVVNENQQPTRSIAEIMVNTTSVKSANNQTKEQKVNIARTSTQPERRTDTVQISKRGAELSRASSGSDSMKPSTVVMSEEKRISSGEIESVMARYKEAQNFMAQLKPGSINSIA